jgi:hypothetical protein
VARPFLVLGAGVVSAWIDGMARLLGLDLTIQSCHEQTG